MTQLTTVSWIGDCDAKMVTFFVVFTAFLAVLVAAILRMYFSQLVPEGLPVDQHHKLRIVGLITKLTGMVVMHLSMVCPRMGGPGNPRELDFVKRTWVGILTSTTVPGWEI